MDKRYKCCICGQDCIGWGNDPWPLVKDEDARCCDDCDTLVIAERIKQIEKNK